MHNYGVACRCGVFIKSREPNYMAFAQYLRSIGWRMVHYNEGEKWTCPDRRAHG